MSDEHHAQRRHRHGDDERRGHPLQHRDRNEGWAERGTWANLHQDGREQERRGDSRSGPHRNRDDGPAPRPAESTHQKTQSTRRSDAAKAFGRDPRGGDHRGTVSQRAHGDRRETPTYKSQGNPRTGSHRGTDSDAAIAGQVGGQFGDLHEHRPSESRIAGYHDDDQRGGRTGRSVADDRFGSRRGHGARRREDPRVRSATTDVREAQ